MLSMMKTNKINNTTFGKLYTNVTNKEVKKAIEQSKIIQKFSKDCDIHISDYKKRNKNTLQPTLEYGLKYRIKESSDKLISKRANKCIQLISNYCLSLTEIPNQMSVTEYRRKTITNTLINEIDNLTIEFLNKLRPSNARLKK